MTFDYFYASITAEEKIPCMACGLHGAKVKWTRIMPLTTPSTTYGFGLPGFYAAKSTRKQSIRTQKPRKVRKITQKIRIFAFGTSMPQVRILSLRPIPVFIRHLSTKIAVLTAIEAAGETLRLFANFTEPVVGKPLPNNK